MPRPSRLAGLSLTDIKSELTRRQSRAGSLRRRRDRLVAQAAALDRELAALGDDGHPRRGRPPKAASGRRGRPPKAASGKRGRRGPRSGPTLGNTLAKVLGDGVMTVTEAVEAVKGAGHKSNATAKSLYHAVAIALAKSGRFRRVGRGRYRANSR